MTESKKTAHTQPPATKHRERHRLPPTRGGFINELLNTMAAHIIAAVVLAIGSVAWLYFVTDPSIPVWQVAIFLALIISFAYLSMLSLTYFFRAEFRISRHLYIHFILVAIIIITVTAPLAITLTYTRVRINELKTISETAKEDLDKERSSRNSLDNRRIQIYTSVTERIKSVLSQPSLNAQDVNDLLNYCIQSIMLGKSEQYNIRGVVFYLDKSGKYLVIPDKGYYGRGFDSDIMRLYFDVSPRATEEMDDTYRGRIGAAGWTFTQKKTILDDDVQTLKAGEMYVFQPFGASDKDQADKSLICVGIPALNNSSGSEQYIGVLSISSPSGDVFNSNDVEVVRFFAMLLGRVKNPIETPAFILKNKSSKK
jgi:hypothetical protein